MEYCIRYLHAINPRTNNFSFKPIHKLHVLGTDLQYITAVKVRPCNFKAHLLLLFFAMRATPRFAHRHGCGSIIAGLQICEMETLHNMHTLFEMAVASDAPLGKTFSGNTHMSILLMLNKCGVCCLQNRRRGWRYKYMHLEQLYYDIYLCILHRRQACLRPYFSRQSRMLQCIVFYQIIQQSTFCREDNFITDDERFQCMERNSILFVALVALEYMV